MNNSDGHDLQKVEMMYSMAAVLVAFAMTVVAIRVGFIYVGYYGIALVIWLAASVTAANIFVYQLLLETMQQKYEEAINAEENRIEQLEKRVKIEQAIEDDRAWEEAQERAFEKEERERAEERSERGRFPFS